MFDLEREVSRWTSAVFAERCKPAQSEAELADHLYCEIDRLRVTGMTQEEAFHAAVLRLGGAGELIAEHDKNRSALGAVCQVVAKIEPPVSRPEHRWLLLGHAVVWAILILDAAWLMKSASGVPPVSGFLPGVVLIPLWWASDQLLRRLLRHQGAAR